MIRNAKRVLKGRIKREDATRRIEGVLTRLDSPSPYVLHVSRLVVYGSCARGALRVGDVDLAIDYDGMSVSDRPAIDAAVQRLDAALDAVEALAPILAADERGRANILASEALRLRRQLQTQLPPVHAMYDLLRHSQQSGEHSAVVDDTQLERLESELNAAQDDFEAALERRLPFPQGTPPLAPHANVMRMIDELSGGDERISVYQYGADMPHDRATYNPSNEYWVWHLLWERGDNLDLSLERLRAITTDPNAGRAPRSGETGREFKP